MSVMPVCISILASFMSSTSFIGIPVAVYYTGTQFWIVLIPAFLAATLACEVFIPIYYKMKLISVNEYIHRRFQSHKLRVMCNVSVLLALVGRQTLSHSLRY
jgi:sodium-coupled monocarboxylate transporter 8/12